MILYDVIITASAFSAAIAMKATGARVHGSDEHEIGRVGYVALGASDRDSVVFKRLAQSFEYRAGIFRDFV